MDDDVQGNDRACIARHGQPPLLWRTTGLAHASGHLHQLHTLAQQLDHMRRAMRTDAADDTMPGLSGDARQRIETELQNKLDH